MLRTKLKKLFLLIFLLPSGCQEKEKAVGPPYSAIVLQLIPLSATQARSEAPQYKYDKATFSTLEDLDNLAGTYFQMQQGGKLTAKYITGSIVFAKNFEQTKNVNLRYKVIDGTVSPKDYSTAAMLSAYYQYDTVIKNIETMTGFSPSAIKEKFGTIKIFFEPTIQLDSDSSTTQSSGKLNAAYVPGAHQFLLFQRSTLEKIPLSGNLQVITHEMGHAIWELAFDNGNTPDCNRINQEYSIRGLNEGFADLLSYTLSGSSDILKNSIDLSGTSTQRNFSIISFKYKDISGGKAETENSICQNSFYCIGTLFANAIYNAQKNSGHDVTTLTGRSELMKIVTNAIKTTKNNMSSTLPAANFTDFCSPSSGDSKNTTYNASILDSFFKAFLDSMSAGAVKDNICSNLKTNFGTDSFPLLSGLTCP